MVIDIKPGGDPNSINLSSKGVIPVAILTTGDFDAGTVDRATVAFAGADALRGALEDVDRDGDLDLILHFRTRDTNIQPGDVEACLTGRTSSGTSFQACDSIRIVPPDADADGDSRGMGMPRMTGDDIEASVGTDQLGSCSSPGHDAWPPDTNGDGKIAVDDTVAYRGRLGSALGDSGYRARLDLDFDGVLDGHDLTTVKQFFGETCSEANPDADGDGFRNQAELFVGTDPLLACGARAFPPDFNDDRNVNVIDVGAMKSVFGSQQGDGRYTARKDLNADGKINIIDIGTLKPFFGKSCK